MIGSLLIPPLLGLGFWQLNRAEEKEKLLQAMATATALMTLPESLPEFPVRISFSGHFDGRYYLLDNRTRAGIVGYEVLAPLRLTDQHRAILINLGWLAGPSQRSELPQTVLPNPPIKLQGWLLPVPSGLQLSPPTWADVPHWPLRIQQPDTEAMSRQLGLRLYGGVVQLDEPLLNSLVSNWQPVNMPPERHLGYAVQWFCLALMSLCWLLWWGTRREGP